MEALPVRLLPGVDLRKALESEVATHGGGAAVVISGIGSLRSAAVRLAGAREPMWVLRDLEILTLAGTITTDGSHLHMTVADSDGRVIGGHVGPGCEVRTTAEVLLLLLPEWSFSREVDPATGFRELVALRRSARDS